MTSRDGTPDAVFLCDGDGFTPTDFARGPWHAASQHGSPTLGLLARAVERHPGGEGRAVARLTVDLMRAAPMAKVWTTSRSLREGKRVEVVEASLWADADARAAPDRSHGAAPEEDAPGDGRLVARATAMRVATASAPIGEHESGDGTAPAMALGQENPPIGFSEGGRTVFHHALEMSPAPGQPATWDEGSLWLRLRIPLVAGETPTPLERVAVASDYAYSVPGLLQLRRDPKAYARQPFVALNADATASLHRMPEGEWLCVASRTVLDAGGLGTAIARLFDQRGALGHVSQSFLVRPAHQRPESWQRYRER